MTEEQKNEMQERARAYALCSSLDSNEQGKINRAYIEGAKWADGTMIDKVCEWLKTNYEDIGIRWMRGYSADDMVDDLKKSDERKE